MPTTPIMEWVKKRCPPLILLNNLPKILPTGRLRQKGAVGWSISGAIPPTKFEKIAINTVDSVSVLGPAKINITPSEVIAARSWVRPVMTIPSLAYWVNFGVLVGGHTPKPPVGSGPKPPFMGVPFVPPPEADLLLPDNFSATGLTAGAT